MTRLLNLRCLLALLALLSVLPFQSASVYAADRVTSPLAALTFRMAGDDLRTRIVVMFDREPKLSTLLLDNPHRLVVDLPLKHASVSMKRVWSLGASCLAFATASWARGVRASS